jgi:hypothetical protein
MTAAARGCHGNQPGASGDVESIGIGIPYSMSHLFANLVARRWRAIAFWYCAQDTH